MKVNIEKSWEQVLKGEFTKPYFVELTKFVKEEYRTQTIYPHPKNIFRAFELCPFDNVKVVILGQDPYQTPGQATGLSFSVPDGAVFQPSLRNIFKELKADIGKEIPNSGNLDHWAMQGVLLLNSTLTVRKLIPRSHQEKGWEEFTDNVIKIISDKKEYVVFILWGSYARSKSKLVDNSKHLILESPHPSPFSADRGFFGSKPFSKTNKYLKEHGLKEIKW